MGSASSNNSSSDGDSNEHRTATIIYGTTSEFNLIFGFFSSI